MDKAEKSVLNAKLNDKVGLDFGEDGWRQVRGLGSFHGTGVYIVFYFVVYCM